MEKLGNLKRWKKASVYERHTMLHFSMIWAHEQKMKIYTSKNTNRISLEMNGNGKYNNYTEQWMFAMVNETIRNTTNHRQRWYVCILCRQNAVVTISAHFDSVNESNKSTDMHIEKYTYKYTENEMYF